MNEMNWLSQIPPAAQPQTYDQGSCAAPKNKLTTATREDHAARAMEQINKDMEHTKQTLVAVPSEYHFKI